VLSKSEKRSIERKQNAEAEATTDNDMKHLITILIRMIYFTMTLETHTQENKQ
jgi:hypothetical protein